MTANQKTRDAASNAFLTAGASAVCLILAELFGLEHANLAVWTTYLFGAERDLGIRFGEAPLWPLRGEWLSQSLMLAVTVLLTMLAAHALGLPPDKASISVMLLTVTPHVQALILKGELRIAGLLM